MRTTTLTLSEWNTAITSAQIRMFVSTKDELNHAKSIKRDYLTRFLDELKGTASEIAVGKLMGITIMPGVNDFKKKPDVPPDIEVRSILNPSHRLIFRDDDPEDRRYILCLCDEAPLIKAIGWIWGRDAKQPKFFDNPNGGRPSWFVPTNCLNPLKPKPDHPQLTLPIQ